MESSRSLFRTPDRSGTNRSLLGFSALLLLSELCGAQVLFDSFGEDWDRFHVLDSPVLPSSTTCEDAVPLDLDGDGILDVAALWGEEVHLLVDPGRRRWRTRVPALGVTGIEAVHPDGSDHHALVTCGSEGVQIWDWDGAAQDVDLRATVEGDWLLAKRVAGYRLLPRTVLAIWDGVSGDVHVVFVRQEEDGTYVGSFQSSFPVGGNVTALAWLDFTDDPLPELAVGTPDGLAIHDLFGVRGAFYAGETEGLAVCGTAYGHERLAWVRHVPRTPDRVLEVIGDTDVEGGVQWEMETVESVGFHTAHGRSFLVVGGADGCIRIFEALSPPSTFSLSASIENPVPFPYTPTRPLLEEFDLSECRDEIDLIVFYEAMGAAEIFHGRPLETAGGPPEIEIPMQHHGFYPENNPAPDVPTCDRPVVRTTRFLPTGRRPVSATPGPRVVRIDPLLPQPSGIPDERARINVFAWDAVPDSPWGERLASVDVSLAEDCVELGLDFAVPPQGLVFEVVVRGLVEGRLVASKAACFALLDLSQGVSLQPIPNFCECHEECVQGGAGSGVGTRGVQPIPCNRTPGGN